MSRYEIAGIDPQDQVVVGWDVPLQTFFCVAMGPDDNGPEDVDPKLWVGCTNGEISSVERLAEAIAVVAVIPSPIAAILRGEAGMGVPTPLQIELRDVFGSPFDKSV
jgi:hypothetical protein